MDSLDSKTCTVRTRWRGRLEVVFVLTDYPAYSSAATARSMRRGALEREIRRARQVLVPLMQKYNVTAMFAGDDH